MSKKYNNTAIVIEYPHTDEWAVSFTDHNPEPEDSIDCKSEADAWKLKKIWDEAMANAGDVARPGDGATPKEKTR
jgi:hypothetical protein